MVIRVTLLNLLSILANLSLILIFIHLIFILLFNIKKRTWLNKYKNILLLDDYISSSYNALILSKNESIDISNLPYLIKLLQQIHNNYADFYFFEQVLKTNKNSNFNKKIIKEFKKIKLYFIFDVVSKKIFYISIQFLLTFGIVLLLHTLLIYEDILFCIY